MNKRAVAFFIGRILLIEAICMIPSTIICFATGDTTGGVSFGAVAVSLVGVGCLLSIFKKSVAGGIHAREGFATVALGWISISLFGSLPFYVSGAIPRFIDAWFETVSGFTTTGASILTNIEALSAGMLYWRSFIVWMGGMGVLVFMLAIVPLAKGSGESMHILRAESPGPVISKLVPRLRSTARILYLIYLVLTAVMVVMLLAGGMPLFDSITTAMSTAGTGGFSIRNANIGYYDSTYIHIVIGVFMMLFGINFSLYYLVLLRDFKTIFSSSELRVYLGVIAVSTAVIALDILKIYKSFGQALHHAFFHVSSIASSTVFFIEDYGLWPQFTRTLLLLLMVFGACAGSTGGGFKVSRFIILWKSLRYEVKKLLHPRSVQVIKIDGKPIDKSVISGVHGYFVLYCLLCTVSMLIISLDSPDFTTTFSSVIATINNMGPGFGIVSPTENYAAFSDLSKAVFTVNMFLGRLEIYPIILIFSPAVWLRGK
jgi:Trk-type K+ transport systems, membrane components